MDGHLADKTVAAGFFAFAPKTFAVAEIDIDGVERRHIGGGGAGQTQRPRQPIGIEKAALRVAVCLRAELGGKVLGAPGQAAEPRA